MTQFVFPSIVIFFTLVFQVHSEAVAQSCHQTTSSGTTQITFSGRREHPNFVESFEFDALFYEIANSNATQQMAYLKYLRISENTSREIWYTDDRLVETSQLPFVQAFVRRKDEIRASFTLTEHVDLQPVPSSVIHVSIHGVVSYIQRDNAWRCKHHALQREPSRCVNQWKSRDSIPIVIGTFDLAKSSFQIEDFPYSLPRVDVAEVLQDRFQLRISTCGTTCVSIVPQ